MLFLNQWNDSCAEKANVDLVIASWAKKQRQNSPLAHCDMDKCIRMPITSKQIELESPGRSGFVRFLIFYKNWDFLAPFV